MLKEAIYKVVTRQDLTEAEMIRAMEVIMTGEAAEAQMGRSSRLLIKRFPSHLCKYIPGTRHLPRLGKKQSSRECL